MGIVTKVVRVFTIVGAIIFLPGLPPYEKLKSFSPSPPLPFEGVLAPKDYALAKAEKMLEGQLVGPECLEASPTDPDVFFASLEHGGIVKISENATKMEPVVNFGKKCAGTWDAKNCGRPLGIRFNKDGHLIASDAYLGIFKINLESGKITHLVTKDTMMNGKATTTFNSVAPARDGKVYFTVSSTNYYFCEGVTEVLAAPSGRLIVYDPVTNENKVLQENIHLANGIILSPEEDFVVFSESLKFRLHKYFISGPKAGTSEIFVDRLPGLPDNLSTSPNGIFVALPSARFINKFDPAEFMFKQPMLRKFMLRLLHLVKLPFDLASYYLDLPIARQVAFNIVNFELLLPILPKYAIILEVDWNGKVINSWHSNSPDSVYFSEAKIINGYMYLGSFINNFVGRIKM